MKLRVKILLINNINNANSLNTYSNLFEEIFAGLWSPASSACKIRQKLFER